ncbi:DUF4240 domain-containing protein [Kitasatospora sp. NPDC002040]|uniref:DUF4240 domain-containing protein n=1 Tax=Kitasatospora sp. NPDC002040 TaxID=3154661 RepID=UPI00332B19CC
MNEDTFWQIIEDCRPAGPDPEAELLAANITDRLARSSLELVTGFAEQLSWALYQLDRKENGQGLSGDAFLYTRAAIVAAGRAVFGRVLQDASAFAPFVIDGVWAESLLYAPDRAYERITGEEWGRDTCYSFESYSNAEDWAG